MAIPPTVPGRVPHAHSSMAQSPLTLKNHSPFLKRALPWMGLALVAPVGLLINAALLSIAPTPAMQAQHQSALTAALLPENNLIQSAYVYDSRDPNKLFGNFYYTLGTQLAAQGQVMAADPLLSKATHLLPQNAYVHLNYGIVLEAQMKNPLAMAQYEEAIRLLPTMPQAYYSLGLLQDKLGQLDSGIVNLQKATGLAPQDPYINYDLGVLYAKKNNYDRSAFYSQRAVQSGIEFAEAYNNYGYALAQLGKYDDALKAIDQSLALKPDSAAAMDSKGFALFGMGKYSDALTVYTDALNLDPTIGEIYLHLGQTYDKLDQSINSCKAYETYLQLTPDAPNKTQVETRIHQLKLSSSSTSKHVESVPKSNRTIIVK